MKKIKIALTGNPNSGKTSIFNMLTGSHQHVANYPGVTVEIKEGVCNYKGYDVTILDLPGIYSLTAYSEEELIARNFLMNEKPDVVVDVIDSSNVERNLYLATGLIEMDMPLVLVFNMSDIAKRKGLVFDIPELEKLLETKIVETVARSKKGRDELLNAVIARYEKGSFVRTHKLTYGAEINAEIEKIKIALEKYEPSLYKSFSSEWFAMKLLEQDCDILTHVTSPQVQGVVEAAVKNIRAVFNEEPEIILADKRYGFISGACQETIRSTVELRHSKSDMIDSVLTHRAIGLPIFLVLMYAVFFLTFKISKYPMAGLEWLFDTLAGSIASAWSLSHALWLKSLITDGIIAGVGGVVVFLPNILILFFAIAILEDTGYMARAAFVMDRIMHKIGLHGKSFIPMLIGFGCTVPAIMSTRILENRRNRLTTIMVLPLISCGARLTIYGLIIPAFFPEQWRGPVLWVIYFVGIILAIIAIKFLRLTVFKGDSEPFVMELPPYRVPTVKALAIHMWYRAWMYLKKAGTTILAISIVLWGLSNFPKPPEQDLSGLALDQQHKVILENSILGRVGRSIEPLIKPLGFDWKIGTALMGATVAKEVFVSQLSIVYAVGDAGDIHYLRQKLQENYTPLVGLCIMIFCLIATPCAATLAAARQETGSWLFPIAQYFILTIAAYIITLIVYQAGLLIIN